MERCPDLKAVTQLLFPMGWDDKQGVLFTPFYEYPGFIQVLLPDGTALNFGDANETFTGDAWGLNDDQCTGAWDSGVRSIETVEACAALIVDAVAAYRRGEWGIGDAPEEPQQSGDPTISPDYVTHEDRFDPLEAN